LLTTQKHNGDEHQTKSQTTHAKQILSKEANIKIQREEGQTHHCQKMEL
jgi:hypothetical protein